MSRGRFRRRSRAGPGRRSRRRIARRSSDPRAGSRTGPCTTRPWAGRTRSCRTGATRRTCSRRRSTAAGFCRPPPPALPGECARTPPPPRTTSFHQRPICPKSIPIFRLLPLFWFRNLEKKLAWIGRVRGEIEWIRRRCSECINGGCRNVASKTAPLSLKSQLDCFCTFTNLSFSFCRHLCYG